MVSRKRSLRAALLTVTALVALTLTAVPSNATFAKKYDLTVSPSSVASGATGVFSATYKNQSLYKLGSVELTIPPGFQKVSATTSRGTISQTATKVTVKNLNLSLYSTFTISVTATAPCGTPTGSWASVGKSTNDFSGSVNFALNNPGNAQKTTVTGTCSLQFVNQPADTGVGDPLNAPGGVSVRALNGASQPVSGVNVAMAATPGGHLSGTSPVATSGSPAAAAFTDLALDATGTYTLTASAPNFASATSDPFDVAGAVLGCDADGGDSYPTQFGGSADSVDLERQTGACNEDIPITITVTDEAVEIQKPFIEGSAFRMTIEWVAETAVNPVPPTQIAYAGEDGSHDMQFCLADGDDGDIYPDLPSGEFWCITNQTVTLFENGANAGKLQLSESYFGAGDPRLTR